MPGRLPDPKNRDETIFAAGASSGGVADVFQRVVEELRGRGHNVAIADLSARQTAAAAAMTALRRSWHDLRSADHVHLEFGSND